MLEPYSKEEEEYLGYLIRKYLPGLYVEEEDSAVMFDEKQTTSRDKLENTKQ